MRRVPVLFIGDQDIVVWTELLGIDPGDGEFPFGCHLPCGYTAQDRPTKLHAELANTSGPFTYACHNHEFFAGNDHLGILSEVMENTIPGGCCKVSRNQRRAQIS